MFLKRFEKAFLRRADGVFPARIRASLWFHSKCGYWPNLRNPQTFNEKATWRKLYQMNNMFPVLADKLAVREYVSSRVGDQYLTKLFAVYESAQEIELVDLPTRVVLKGTHDNGSVLLIDDTSSMPVEKVRLHFQRHLAQRYGESKSEWWYAQIKPRVIAEERLLASSGIVPPDYKLFVFDGAVEMIQVDTGRFQNHLRTLYRPDWTRIDGSYAYPPGPDLPVPKDLTELIGVAARLGSGIDFVRVDLYAVDGRIVVGELTLAPESGNGAFRPRELDHWLGRFWVLDG